MALSPSDCDFIRTLVRRRSGIVLERDKVYLVETRLAALARRERLASLENLLAKLHTPSANDLDDKGVRVLAILGQALHHRAEQRLRKARGAVERLFDCELPRPLRPFDLRP